LLKLVWLVRLQAGLEVAAASRFDREFARTQMQVALWEGNFDLVLPQLAFDASRMARFLR
jgi:hypothetical protein